MKSSKNINYMLLITIFLLHLLSLIYFSHINMIFFIKILNSGLLGVPLFLVITNIVTVLYSRILSIYFDLFFNFIFFLHWSFFYHFYLCFMPRQYIFKILSCYNRLNVLYLFSWIFHSYCYISHVNFIKNCTHCTASFQKIKYVRINV